jgi:hypothetical protein
MLTVSMRCRGDTWRGDAEGQFDSRGHENWVRQLWGMPDLDQSELICGFDLCVLAARCGVAVDSKVYIMDY